MFYCFTLHFYISMALSIANTAACNMEEFSPKEIKILSPLSSIYRYCDVFAGNGEYFRISKAHIVVVSRERSYYVNRDSRSAGKKVLLSGLLSAPRLSTLSDLFSPLLKIYLWPEGPFDFLWLVFRAALAEPTKSSVQQKFGSFSHELIQSVAEFTLHRWHKE